MLTAYRTQNISLFHHVADDNGFLYDLDPSVDVVEWSIYYAENDPWVLIDGVNTLNLNTSNISKGIYSINWEIPIGSDIGRYYLLVKTIFDSGEEKQYLREFEVVENQIPFLDSTHLCLIRDIRAEGIDPATTGDWKIARALIRAKEYIEMYCGRRFSPIYKDIRCDIEVSGEVHFPEPICVLQEVTDFKKVNSYFDTEYPSMLYARHLRSNSGGPSVGNDDRDNPKYFNSSLTASENYWFTGVYGYTEYDGSEIGRVPEQIRLAAINLTLKYQASLLGGGGGSGTIPSFSERIIKEKTATQEYHLSPLTDENALNMVAGDTELARLLRPYKRPPIMAII